MRAPRQLLLLLVAAILLIGSAGPAQADAAKSKKKASACQTAKAKAKKKPTAARKRAARRACRKPAKKKPAAPQAPTDTDTGTTPEPTPTPDTTSGSDAVLERGVVDCANRERAARGIAALTVDPALTRAAEGHAADMARRDYFDHETPEGRTPWDRIEAALQGADPFRAMGENIAKGYGTAEATCEGWMNSPGHKRNILDPNFTLIGAGWVDGYAVQNFGDR